MRKISRTACHFCAVFLAILLAACSTQPPSQDLSGLQSQVAATESAFAKTMSDRDHAAFTSFISDEAVFFSRQGVLRGKKAVSDAWKPFFEKPEAPFSWKPEQVEVLESGTLAISSGPVFNGQGNKVGVYSSIWRQEQPGVWRIVFDKGGCVCESK